MSYNKEYLKNKLKRLLAYKEAAARKELNKAPHFLSLDDDLLETMLKDSFKDGVDFKVVIRLLHEHVESYAKGNVITAKNGRLYSKGNRLLTTGNISSHLPALLSDGAKYVGLLAVSFGAVQKNIFTNFLNSKKLSEYLKDGKSFQVGHTEVYTNYNTDIEGRVAQTVASYQTNKVIDSINRSLDSSAYTEDKKEIMYQVLNNIMHTRDSFEVHSTYGQKLSVNLEKDFQEGLLSIKANIVLVQDSEENRSWGVEEKRFLNEVRDCLHLLHFSNNALEEVASQVSLALSGKKIKSSKSTLALEEILSAVSTTTKSANIKLQPLRTKKGSFTSLTSIKNMINMQLMEQVAKNMGKGTAKSILNFRTGRFAASAHVEQLVRNKDASLTAYYTYLKYPYATFSEGGAQEFPKTRDPRLLISKSIRQLAANIVSERLKTIVV